MSAGLYIYRRDDVGHPRLTLMASSLHSSPHLRYRKPSYPPSSTRIICDCTGVFIRNVLGSLRWVGSTYLYLSIARSNYLTLRTKANFFPADQARCLPHLSVQARVSNFLDQPANKRMSRNKQGMSAMVVKTERAYMGSLCCGVQSSLPPMHPSALHCVHGTTLHRGDFVPVLSRCPNIWTIQGLGIGLSRGGFLI